MRCFQDSCGEELGTECTTCYEIFCDNCINHCDGCGLPYCPTCLGSGDVCEECLAEEGEEDEE